MSIERHIDGLIITSDLRVAGGTGEAGGLKKNDVITHADGRRMQNTEEFLDAINYVRNGRTNMLLLTVQRGAEQLDFVVTK
ncbi:MAG: PDZ domain-containing protein [Candidatus Methylomirabilales bacterium]